eukprot:TRINITY_DN50367_c0_g1_i1.p1 TRINITY_DN50367_c0_g1~~TRINITY_DN50367_c0_g1_i1.p1  ORF type:complete len:583 (-),score=135.25 TRINITY_DN50367_c0_g1_i1:70-1818(-)
MQLAWLLLLLQAGAGVESAKVRDLHSRGIVYAGDDDLEMQRAEVMGLSASLADTNPELAAVLTNAMYIDSSDPNQTERSLEQVSELMLDIAQARKNQSNQSALVDAADEIIRILDEHIKAAILVQLASLQTWLDEAHDCFDRCDIAMERAYAEGVKLNGSCPSLSAAHKQCREEEEVVYLQVTACQKNLSDLESNLSCARDSISGLDTIYPERGRELCNNREGDAGDHYQNLYEFWDGYLKEYDANMTAYRETEAQVNATKQRCSNLTDQQTIKRQDCNNLQAKLDTTSCAFVKEFEKGCEEFYTGYDLCFYTYLDVNASIASRQARIQQEWRSMLRIDCFAHALRSDDLDSELKACINASYDVSNISVNKTTVPPPKNETPPYHKLCGNLSADVPITIDYNRTHFQDLPPHAQPEMRPERFCQVRSTGQQLHEQVLAASHFVCRRNRTIIPAPAQATYSSKFIEHPDPGLNGQNAWAPAVAEFGQSMTVDLGKEELIGGAFLQGGSSAGECVDSWVTTYRFDYSLDNVYWETYSSALRGNHNCNGRVASSFSRQFPARFVRFVVQTWHGWASMRVGILSCS